MDANKKTILLSVVGAIVAAIVVQQIAYRNSMEFKIRSGMEQLEQQRSKTERENAEATGKKEEWRKFCEEANPYGAASDLLAERVASFYTSANLPISYKIGSGGMPNIVYTEMKADDGGFLSEKMIGLISAGLKQAGNEELLAQFDNEVVPEIRAGIKKRGEWENHRADCNREGFY